MSDRETQRLSAVYHELRLNCVEGHCYTAPAPRHTILVQAAHETLQRHIYLNGDRAVDALRSAQSLSRWPFGKYAPARLGTKASTPSRSVRSVALCVQLRMLVRSSSPRAWYCWRGHSPGR